MRKLQQIMSRLSDEERLKFLSMRALFAASEQILDAVKNV
jgi:hypothetical protein